jgi:hypothetical protein
MTISFLPVDSGGWRQAPEVLVIANETYARALVDLEHIGGA